MAGVSRQIDVPYQEGPRSPHLDRLLCVPDHWAVHNLEQQTNRTQALAEIFRVLRAGGQIVLTDLSNREKYLMELRRLGCRDVRLVVSSALRDSVNKII